MYTEDDVGLTDEQKGLITALGMKGTVKEWCETLSADSLAGPVPRRRVARLMRVLTSILNSFSTIRAIPGIKQAAKDQFGDQAYDVIAVLLAVETDATLVRDWIFNNFPKDTNSGAWLIEKFTLSNSDPVDLTFSSALMGPLRTRLDALAITASQ